MKILLICLTLMGCSYNAFNDPHMRFWDQPAPVVYESPREKYFKD